jgi:WXG100 family type VII secretion target
MVDFSTILRHEAQLRQVAAQLREANSIIESAKAGAESAATELASNWEGDARDAFVAEQVRAKTWITQMISIVLEISVTIDRINSQYTDLEANVTQIITSK